MYQLLKIAIILIVFFTATNCKKKSADIVYNKKYIDEIKEARKEISFYMARNFVPGGTFAVSKNGEIIYSEGMGVVSKDLEVPATRNSKFRIGELSEMFTSLIYRQLIDNGTLHPDSTVQHYIPDFPELNYKLPIRYLPYHISGIRAPNVTEEDWRGLNISLQQGLDNFKNDSLLAPPGFYELQSMYNYNLLGAVMEKATGKRFHTLLKEYVTDTLKLTNTVVDNPFATITGRTNFYDHNLIAQVINATFRDMRYRAPSKGILSNAEDLVKFGNAFLESDLITEKMKSEIFTPLELPENMRTSIPNGWMIFETRDGRIIYGRSGHVTGGGAVMIIYPEEKLVIAGTINLTGKIDEVPVFQIAEFFISNPTEVSEVDETKQTDKN